MDLLKELTCLKSKIIGIKGQNLLDVFKIVKEIYQSMEKDLIEYKRNLSKVYNELNNNQFSFSAISPEMMNAHNHKMLQSITDTPKYEENKTKTYSIGSIKYDFPIIKSLQDIPIPYYYFEGNKRNKIPAGLYMCVGPNTYVQICIPDIISSNTRFYKTDPCKYKNVASCMHNKRSYYSGVRYCNYSHIGEKLIKIGPVPRCRRNPILGSKSTLNKIEMDQTSHKEIKTILMYGISDIMVAFCKSIVETPDNSIIYRNLDVVEEI